MAKKVDVSFADIKSDANFTRISVESALQKANANASYIEPRADVSVVQIDAGTVYRLLTGQIAWTEAQATEIYLDPDTKNRFFEDGFVFSDQPELNPEKVFLETLGLTDAHALVLDKQLTDQMSFSDVVSVTLVILRDFPDAVTVSDVVLITAEKNLSESVSIAELLALVLEVPHADAVSVSEDHFTTFESSKIDSFSTADLFSRTNTFGRTFADAFSLDDQASVDAFAVDTSSSKTNVFSFSDVQVFSVAKNLSDSFSLTEATSFSLDNTITDSLSLAELIEINLISSNNSVLNTSALNTFTLNS